MIAWIFPGQGSQRVGMGTELTSRAAHDTFAAASEILGWDVLRTCERGPTERLNSTEVTQPAVFTVSVAVARSLDERGIRPGAVGGHSVGEFAALVAAGALGFEDALRAVAARGEAMRRAGRAHPGGMAAVVGLPARRVEALCAGARGEVRAANLNGPEQVVISGEETGIAEVAAAVRAEGGRVIRLQVSVAAHSPLMTSARDEVATVLRDVAVSVPAIPFFSCVTGDIHERPDEIAELLVRGVTQPVRWVDCVHAMRDAGADLFVEAGPGSVLCGLVRRIAPDVETVQVEDDDDVEALAQRLAVASARGPSGSGG